MLVSLGFGYYPWKGLRMASKPTVSFDDFAKLDLRVGTIKAVEPHPNADKLLKMQVDLGDEQRQICAGIKPYTEDPQALVGQQIVVVADGALEEVWVSRWEGEPYVDTFGQP